MKTTRASTLAGTAIAALVLASCSSVSVRTDSDPNADFGKYRTFAIVPPASGAQSMSPSTQAAFEAALKDALGAKGVTPAPNPSFLVVNHVTTREMTDVYYFTDWNSRLGVYGYGTYGYWPGYGEANAFVSRYIEGTLVVDFVDPATKRVFWRGVAKGVVGSAKENREHVAEAVGKMLQGYPPKR